MQLDTVRAYHFGPRFLVEIECVMAPETPLNTSHDLGIILQHKVEKIDCVERCFVHIDYSYRDFDDHDPEIPLTYKVSNSPKLRMIVPRDIEPCPDLDEEPHSSAGSTQPVRA